MAHNLSLFDHFHRGQIGRIDFFHQEKLWTNPAAGSASVIRNGGGIRFRLAAGSSHFDVIGEDLFALREFLAELPEEAFVRPKDPVDGPPRWVDGDIVKRAADSTITYIRHNGAWDRVSRGKVHPGNSSDLLVSSLVDQVGYLVVLQQNA